MKGSKIVIFNADSPTSSIKNKMSLISIKQVAEHLKLSSKLSLRFISFFLKICGIEEINKLYSINKKLDGIDFVDAILRQKNIKLSFNKNKIPENENFVIVCNHPHGILDGLILIKILSQKRNKFKIVVNSIFDKINPLKKHIISVNPFVDNKKDYLRYRDGKKILNSFKLDIPIIFFPAGAISYFSCKNFKVKDGNWNNASIKMILKTKRDIIPIYIDGRNSIWFLIIRFLYKKASFFWLAKEFLNKKDKTINIYIGEPITNLPLEITAIKKKIYDKVYSLKKESI